MDLKYLSTALRHAEANIANAVTSPLSSEDGSQANVQIPAQVPCSGVSSFVQSMGVNLKSGTVIVRSCFEDLQSPSYRIAHIEQHLRGGCAYYTRGIW